MNVQKCINGHFFDGDKYDLCPHCGAIVAGNTEAKKNTVSKKQQSVGKKKEESMKAETIYCQQCGKIIRAQASFCGYCGAKQKKDDLKEEKTIGKTFGVFDTDNTHPDEKKESIIDHNIPTNNSFKMDPKVELKDNEGKIPLFVQTEPVEEKDEELKNAVKNIAAASQGKTVGFFSSGRVDNANNEVCTSEPVVGWLVCVKGKHFGESFHIEAGRNSIGRSDSNKIVLGKDASVSREKHAWITYEPKKREFYIQPGESSGLSYLNNDTLMEVKRINGYDKLELGNSMFLLIPLCGENFTWEDYLNGED